MLLGEEGETFRDLIMLLIMLVFLATSPGLGKDLIDDACLIL